MSQSLILLSFYIIQMQKQNLINKFDLSSRIKLKSGNYIPIVGYGTYELKGQNCLQGLQIALKSGYRHIDTASIYRNENQISKILQKLKIPRHQMYITSKIAPTQQGYKQSLVACEQIIAKLNCKYLNLILIHWPGVAKIKVDSQQNAIIRLQTWKALIQLKTQGKVKDIGVSNFLKHHLQHLLKYSQQIPVVNQIQAHPLLWQKQTIEYCRQHDIIVQAYSPLVRGRQDLMKNKLLQSLATKYKKTVAQIALRYLMQHNMVILPKSKTQKRILQNIDIFDFQITQNDMKKIEQLHSYNLRTCWNPESIKY